jgi:hypothetical protein
VRNERVDRSRESAVNGEVCRSAPYLRLAVLVLALVAGAALPGCSRITGGEDVYEFVDRKGTVLKPQQIVEAVDWDQALVFEIDIRQNEFRPSIVHLFQGEPYIMVVENRDDHDHMLAAPSFFRTVAIRKIVTEREEITGVNLLALSLKPGEIKEVHFVPVRDGWYDFEGGETAGIFPGVFLSGFYSSPFSRGAREGMVGVFVVEQ